MAYIELKTNIDECIELMDDLVTNEKRTRKSILSQVGTKAKTQAKRNYKSILHKRTGNLYKSIRKYVYHNGRAAVITAHKADDKVRYGFVLAHGTTIKPVNHKVLTFQINGKWYRRHEVVIKPHDFIERPVLEYVNGPQIDRDLEKITANIIKKTEERAAKAAAKAMNK